MTAEIDEFEDIKDVKIKTKHGAQTHKIKSQLD
jgi:hypothetical protein